ncbi:phosphoserine phosphatase SerB, partial [Mesorhizobium sp. M7A.F.Ca.CA.001.11.2.1]
MPLIATLVSRPTERALSLSLANMASRSVGASAVVWLAEGIACDLVLPEAADAAAASAVLRTALASEAVDVIVQEAETRRKKILIADMDSTMIDQECIDELADEIGVKDHVA